MSETPKVAYLFPGQGAQYVGMGQSLQAENEVGRELLEQANDVLGFDLIGLCANGDEAELSQTANCQPAILAVSVAALRAAQAALGDRLPAPAAVAGLSLGEYSALVAAGALSYEDALQLVRKRGQFMQDAGEQNPGGMFSIIALKDEEVVEICEEASAAGEVVAANFNCPGQVAISGEGPALEKAGELAKARGAKMVIPLKVSGAFHSKLMAPASERLEQEIQQTTFQPPGVPVISNVTADAVADADEAKQRLVEQLCNPVLWTKSIQKLIDDGVEVFYEIGPGKVLAGLMRRIDRSKRVINIETPEDLAALAT